MVIYSISNSLGKSFIIVYITFSNISSSLAPSPLLPPSELQANKDSSNKFVSFKFLVISAFALNPNTSGCVSIGRLFTKILDKKKY